MKKDNFSSDIAPRISEERVRLGLTQEGAATACGVSREMWGRYERGGAAMGGECLRAFAVAGADVLYILNGARSGQAQSAQESLNPGRLRMAVILTEDAAAVRQLTPEQRADMILSFYQRLSKGDVQ